MSKLDARCQRGYHDSGVIQKKTTAGAIQQYKTKVAYDVMLRVVLARDRAVPRRYRDAKTITVSPSAIYRYHLIGMIQR